MPLQVASSTLERVAIVDDDKSVRTAYEMSVEELDLRSVSEPGPLGDLDRFARAAAERAEAAVCDFKLRVKSYANFDGAELVARWYELGFPAILCTKWEEAGIDEIRRYRHRIPVLLRPSELEPDRIVSGLAQCIREIEGTVVPSRRTWRTLVRVEDVSGERSPYVYVVIPAWDPNEVIRLLLGDIPSELHPDIRADARVYAHVNIGAESNEELFFRAWERLQ